MVAQVDQGHIFHELAGAVVNIVTKKAFTNFFEKNEDDKIKVISKTFAAAFAAGIVGSALTPSGTVAFIVSQALAFGHFTRTFKVDEQEIETVHQNQGVFHALANTVISLASGKTVKEFKSLTQEEQVIVALKVAGIATAIGLIASLIGGAGVSLFFLSLPFTTVHFISSESESSSRAQALKCDL